MQDQMTIDKKTVMEWLDAVVDYAEKEEIQCDVCRCRVDGWMATLVVGSHYVSLSPRRRAMSEGAEDYYYNVKSECSAAVQAAIKGGIKRRTGRMVSGRAA